MKKTLYILTLSILATACRKPYDPPVVQTDHRFLVVEGLINTGSDSTIIKLSRTVNIKSASTIRPELGATVTVESDQNNNYPLNDAANGNYVSAGINADPKQKYRLRIHTTDGNTYLSDFCEAKITQPIDSIETTIKTNGVDIRLDTHDPTNTSRYYRWKYEENYRFHAYFDSYFMAAGYRVIFRPADKDIYGCFAADTSSTIILNSTAKLAQDVVYQTPITFVPSTSEKLETTYSIHVTQYALTADAYNYYTQLQKNTQQLGSIFDAQPSQLASNIHCINNPSIPVIGYITAGTYSERRIYIQNHDLPAWVPVTFYDSYQYYGCGYFVQNVSTPEQFQFWNQGNPPFYTPTIDTVTWAPTICVDCRLRGSLTPPPFWPK